MITNVCSLLKLALTQNEGVMSGFRFVAYEWETEFIYRALVQAADKSETDVEFNKVTKTYCLWIDGTVQGDSRWN